ncbi:ribbon-helix-helix domain-containing protein [Commensalibacter intestini]|nr:ribbon-helix-helix domain-containing protein [Commensalibacter intestini]
MMTKKPVSSLKDVLLQDQKRKLIIDTKEGGNDLVQLNFRIDQAAKTQLEFLRLEIGSKSIQSLMIEAINDLFEKHGKNRIA